MKRNTFGIVVIGIVVAVIVTARWIIVRNDFSTYEKAKKPLIIKYNGQRSASKNEAVVEPIASSASGDVVERPVSARNTEADRPVATPQALQHNEAGFSSSMVGRVQETRATGTAPITIIIGHMEIKVSVKSDGRTITASDSEGKEKWSVDLLSGFKGEIIGKPEVRSITTQGDKIIAVLGKHSLFSIEARTGNIMYLGSD